MKKSTHATKLKNNIAVSSSSIKLRRHSRSYVSWYVTHLYKGKWPLLKDEEKEEVQHEQKNSSKRPVMRTQAENAVSSFIIDLAATAAAAAVVGINRPKPVC